MVFWRLKCHACGTRSQYSKGPSITQFQCTQCQTWNFVDSNGDYVDPPARFVHEQAEQQRRIDNASIRPPSQQPIFCSTCLQNQKIYHELLSNYLPDEDDPEYFKYERALPQYKRDLEKRYPQICKSCAPKAQSMIHEADYYSMTNNASRLMEQSRGDRRSLSPAGIMSRDSVSKMLTRMALTLVGFASFLSAAYQVLWHAFAMMALQQHLVHMRNTDDAAIEQPGPLPKASQCLEEASRLRFSFECYVQASTLIPRALFISLCLIWYNHGLKKLYIPEVRIASVTGWRQHLAISTFTLLVRWLAYTILTGHTAQLKITDQQALAINMVAIILIVAGHILARRCIDTHRWKVTGSIMPRPEERDVLSQYAGPAPEKHTPRASLTPVKNLLSKQSPQRFPIEKLGGRRTRNHAPEKAPQVQSDDGDPMDIEPVPPASVQTPYGLRSSNFGQSTGWDAVRTNLFSIEDEARAKQERSRQVQDSDKHMYFNPTQPTPFRGRLPQAPMSQERRLRNPITQVPQFKEVPITQRRDFLQQMRNGIDQGKGFDTRQASIDSNASTSAATRTRGQLDLKPSEWHLESDVNTSTGLEDLFVGAFKLNDRPETMSPVKATSQMAVSPRHWYTAGIATLAALGVMFVLDVSGLRRSICLYLVHRLEAMGY